MESPAGRAGTLRRPPLASPPASFAPWPRTLDGGRRSLRRPRQTCTQGTRAYRRELALGFAQKNTKCNIQKIYVFFKLTAAKSRSRTSNGKCSSFLLLLLGPTFNLGNFVRCRKYFLKRSVGLSKLRNCIFSLILRSVSI